MQAKIIALNSAFLNDQLPIEEYEAKARDMLSGLDWQRRIKYVNQLYVSV